MPSATQQLSCLFAGLIGLALVPAASSGQQTQYDLLLKNGRVVDAKNHLAAIRDVAIRDGKIAAVAEHIDSTS